MTLSNALIAKMASMGVVESEGIDNPLMISSGSMGLDIALGGGLARGRLTTLSSPIPGYGKDTTVNLFCRVITTAPPGVMLNGGRVAIFDQERKLSKEWLRRMGADLGKVSIFHAASGEAMFYAIFNMIKENAFDLIVVNTVSATGFSSQIEAVNGGGSTSDEADDGETK